MYFIRKLTIFTQKNKKYLQNFIDVKIPRANICLIRVVYHVPVNPMIKQKAEAQSNIVLYWTFMI